MGDTTITTTTTATATAIAERMAADRDKLQSHPHGGLDDLHTELDKSPIHDAARENELEQMHQIVAARGIQQIHTVDKYGLTALHWAADRGHAAIAQFLLDHGANVNQVEKRLFRRTPLHFAAIAPSLVIVQMLVAHGADPRAVDHRGWNAYHCASYAGATDVLRVLSDHDHGGDANLNAPTTAVAARNGQTECVAFLLAASSKLLTAVDATGHRAIEYAKQAGHTNVLQLLDERAAAMATACSRAGEAQEDTRSNAAMATKDARAAAVLSAPVGLRGAAAHDSISVDGAGAATAS